MRCANCGAEIREGLRFCTNCGIKLENAMVGCQQTYSIEKEIQPVMEPSVKENILTENAEEDSKRENRKSLWSAILIEGIAVVYLAIACYSVFFYIELTFWNVINALLTPVIIFAFMIGLASLIRILSDIREKLTTDFEE